ncbi:major capsid protein P2 [Thaumasiovibrio subtropicus]|uniref:major capsid protein P2 n=1 Tax=Thaumasiovibrio subtropicus TaxID=1891207 RepID=UPI000B34C127|nr:major capsid protein P2 [Thaumasiovibrio subtropicus]
MEMVSTPFAPRPKELDPFEGVGWGNRSMLSLAAGPTYYGIELITNITDPKDIERVEVTLNGDAKINVTGETLVALQKHRKNYVEAGRYIIPLGDQTMRTKVGVRHGELVTLPGELWIIYVTLKSKAADVTPPIVRARAHLGAAQQDRYFLPRIYELSWTCSQTGRIPHDWKERSPFLNIKRIHFKDDSVERIRVLRDNLEEINVTKADNAFDLAHADLEQNPGWFSLDFCRYGFGNDGQLNTAANMQLAFELDKTEVGNIPVIVEAVQQVKPLPTAA